MPLLGHCIEPVHHMWKVSYLFYGWEYQGSEWLHSVLRDWWKSTLLTSCSLSFVLCLSVGSPPLLYPSIDVLRSSDCEYRRAGSWHPGPSLQTLTKELSGPGKGMLLSLSGCPRANPQISLFSVKAQPQSREAVPFRLASTNASPSPSPGGRCLGSLALHPPYHREFYACEGLN